MPGQPSAPATPATRPARRTDEPMDRADLFEAVHCRARRSWPRARRVLLLRRGRALGRPVDPRAAQLPVRPRLRRAGVRSSRPTAATTCTAGTRCAPRSPSGRRLPGVEPAASSSRLSDADVRTLVQALHPAPLRRARRSTRIVERAEGNAFFTEELVGRRRASAAGSLPDDLADLLLVRLDQLDDAARQIVRAASVAGRRVSHELLAARRRPRRRAALDQALRAAVEQQRAACRSAPTATRSGTPCSPRRSTTTCCPASGCGCTRAYAAALRSRRRRRHRRRARPARAGRPRPRRPRSRASIAGRRRGDVGRRPGRGGPPLRAARSSCSPTRADEPITRRRVDAVALAVKAGEAVAAAGHTYRACRSLARPARASCRRRRRRPRPRPAAATRSRRRALVTDTDVDVLGVTTEALRCVPSRPGRRRCAPSCSACTPGPDSTAVATTRRRRWANEALADRLSELRVPGVDRRRDHHADPDRRALRRPGRAPQRRLLEIVAEARADGDDRRRAARPAQPRQRALRARPDREAPRGLRPRRTGRCEAGRPWAPYGLEARLLGGIAAYVDGDWDDALRIARRHDDLAPAAGRGRRSRRRRCRCTPAAATSRRSTPAAAPARRCGTRDGLFAILTGAAAIDLHGDRGDLEAATRGRTTTSSTPCRAAVGEHVLPGPGPAHRADARPARRRRPRPMSADERAAMIVPRRRAGRGRRGGLRRAGCVAGR